MTNPYSQVLPYTLNPEALNLKQTDGDEKGSLKQEPLNLVKNLL